MLALNPVVLLIILYLFVNFLTMVLGCMNDGVKVETTFFKISAESLVYSFILQVSCLLFLYVLYRLFYKKISHNDLTLGNSWGAVLFIIQFTFALFNYKMGINTAGSTERIEGGSFTNYLFILLQPDNIAIIISLCLKSPFLFWLNIVAYTFSMLLRGWMSGIFIIFFLILSRYPYAKISLKSFIRLFFCLLILLAVMPAIIEAKWAMRTGVSALSFISGIPSYFTIDRYSMGTDYLLNRFQHVGHLALILDNSSALYREYSENKFSGYYWEGLPQIVISKLLNIEVNKVTTYLVGYFFNIPNPSWNINVGLVGWLFILRGESVFFVFYILAILCLPYYIVSKYAGKKLLNILSCFSIVFLFHGWLGAYVNLAIYACLISLLANTKIYIRSS
ncbi:oligosaccharide repeat unit polymerase [Trabulsiella odontotermitis]|uniref:oligosaccharide repeat unit polymerase n=1 Tax=Trabulsiella odontotermitis TaxID=379893 RepID=UPI003211B184